jgi:hypothetical protein
MGLSILGCKEEGRNRPESRYILWSIALMTEEGLRDLEIFTASPLYGSTASYRPAEAIPTIGCRGHSNNVELRFLKHASEFAGEFADRWDLARFLP